MSLQIKKHKRKKLPNSHKLYDTSAEQTFLEHLTELRNRLVTIGIVICGGALFAYSIQRVLINLLVRPAHGQHFIYTSPIGGVGFVFSLTTDFGLFLAIPLIVYEILSFISPALKNSTRRAVIRYCIASGVLAFVGIICGYYFGLPLVLGFLTKPLATNQIQALFTISEYLSFVSYYLFAAAMIMQIPVLLLFINRIKPIKPQKLLHYERHVIVMAFIISAIMAPTINVLDLLLIAGPIILIYNLTIFIIWRLKRSVPDLIEEQPVKVARPQLVDVVIS